MSESKKKALNSAIRFLSVKARHSREIYDKLSSQGFQEKDIKAVLKELERLGLVDDKDWIESFVRRETAKKFGKRSILQKLAQKGIPPESAFSALEQLQPPEKQKEIIENLLKTRYRAKDLSDYRQKQQVMASLARKGFNFALIEEVVKLIVI